MTKDSRKLSKMQYILWQALGLRYLWADTICIVQDDQDDKNAQIMAMNRAYQGALFALIPAYGKGANAGLLGVWPGSRRWQQHVEHIRGVHIANRRDYSLTTKGTTWETRGWTYREKVSATRTVTVTPGSVWFKANLAFGK
jgi:hypothetical protein